MITQSGMAMLDEFKVDAKRRRKAGAKKGKKSGKGKK